MQEQDDLTAYMRLWQMVVLQAYYDISGSSFGDRQAELGYLKEDSLNWLFSGNKDFYTVCDFAHLHPEEIRAGAKRLLDKKVSSFFAQSGKRTQRQSMAASDAPTRRKYPSTSRKNTSIYALTGANAMIYHK